MRCPCSGVIMSSDSYLHGCSLSPPESIRRSPPGHAPKSEEKYRKHIHSMLDCLLDGAVTTAAPPLTSAIRSFEPHSLVSVLAMSTYAYFRLEIGSSCISVPVTKCSQAFVTVFCRFTRDAGELNEKRSAANLSVRQPLPQNSYMNLARWVR
ncbi:hypothetical protein HBI56_196260 [Parastagonospora nodorum]|nr:hypothetical protein HBH53_199760 [Parastagonospora nodorum]KAH3960394.1 hypothetical protein HBH51_191590 [Parastagonospora nodorum]KAH3965252.1 hypothetical protein HBH52_206460 [Parastagonospora nodorum]KAH4016378.1 hypothetical protein HBI09_202390 [Parastagonospora nodorum]KAH4050016.1 hypothetical protein HBH49_140950 [Parastagonospora nodorum]